MGLAITANPLIFVAGTTRLELATSGVTGRRSNQLNYAPEQICTFSFFAAGRRNRVRTCDPRLVRPMLSQLSYPPPLNKLLIYNRPIHGLSSLPEGKIHPQA
jgi:hypothetical protein